MSADPGPPPTSADPGLPPTLADPGLPPTSADPGLPPTSADPGPPPTSADPGLPPTSADPGLPPKLAGPGLPPPSVDPFPLDYVAHQSVQSTHHLRVNIRDTKNSDRQMYRCPIYWYLLPLLGFVLKALYMVVHLYG